MKRSFSIIFSFLCIFPSMHAMDLSPSVFDRVPKSISGYLYGLPQFFSAKHQLHTYGIPIKESQDYEPLDQTMHDEIVFLLKEIQFDPSSIFITQLNAARIQDTPGFIVTSSGIFIDPVWWRSIGTTGNTFDGDREESQDSTAQEIKRFFISLMVEQLKKGQYRKQLATKMIVDGILVSTIIGIATYTVAPSVCSWVAQTVPGTGWLESVTTGIATTANQTCDQFYAPSLCIMAGKTAWSSLLAPGVGPCVHALLTEPVARYLAQQSCSKALESIINKQALIEYCKEMKTLGKSNDQFDQVLDTAEQSEVYGDIYDE